MSPFTRRRLTHTFDHEHLHRHASLILCSARSASQVTKYRHKEGKLVLKVTDDRKCIKYATDQQSDLNKMARLNALMLGLCAHGPAEMARLQREEQDREDQDREKAERKSVHTKAGDGKHRKKRGRRT